jgi:hypothetical protein
VNDNRSGIRLTGHGDKVRRLLPVLLVGAGACLAQLEPVILGFDRLENGNTVIAAVHFNNSDSGLAIEVDSLGQVVWGFLGGGLVNVHTARRLENGNTLISATGADRVIEFDEFGNDVWSFDDLSYPNDAYRLDNGNTLITDRDNDRVIEVNRGGEIVWSYTNLIKPHNGSRLENGNTLICDSERDQVIEVDPAGVVVWRLADGLSWPRSAQRLEDGNTLIADSRHNRVVEVDTAGNEVWSFAEGIGMPYMVERLADGRTLVSAPDHLVEVDGSGELLWQWPGTVEVIMEGFRVYNPVSGCSLAVRIHRPILTTGEPIPAVVLVPDGLQTGRVFEENGLADLIAGNRLAALHFDVDGRGQSDSSAEDYYGRINQAGLHACIAALAGMSYVDTARIGVLTEGYGIALAAGMLADPTYPQSAKFLVDFEGPADRYQSWEGGGGVVPVPPDSESFWQEREAVRFMSQMPCLYLRVQTQVDHNIHIVDNRHCIALIDSATMGGLLDHGISPWTRVNDSMMNEPNRFYTLEDPPVWIPEAGEAFTPIRYLFYLKELVGLLEQTPVRERKPVDSPAVVIGVRPNPFRARTVIDLRGQDRCAVQILDMAGRLVRTLPAERGAVWDGRDELGQEVPSGVYCCRLKGSEARVSVRSRLVKL